ncbi:hypothetical protein L6R50_06575 [Myxococcota bacterium]|nr:hypothetical protein [Myxococcota bacterium]
MDPASPAPARGSARLVPRAAALAAAASLAACAPGEDPPPGPGPDPPAGPSARMDFTRAGGFWSSPFPSDDRVVGGAVDLGGFPNPDGVPFVGAVLGLLDGRAEGFGTTSGIFFSMEAEPVSLPDLEGTMGEDAPVLLVDVEPGSPDHGRRWPLRVGFEADAGPFGGEDLLALLPLQGLPLRPGERYAAVLTPALPTVDGPLGVAPAVEAIRAGTRPEGMGDGAFGAYRDALGALDALGVEVAALAVFTTGRPEADLDALLAAARERPPSPLLPFALTDAFDAFCVYQSEVEMPVYQSGDPPYLGEGGEILFQDGVPVFDHGERARVVVTVPRAPAPEGGWPTTVFVRTGGGGDRPLVDRGPRAEPGGEAVEPGTGPALHLARAGHAGVSVDGPLGGIRNATGGDEQFLIFNVTNPGALRDNLRQSAVELALLPALLEGLALDVTACGGAGEEARFAPAAIMGHSMGATIAPLTLALAGEYRAAVLSGAGGSWIENVLHKLSPLEVRPIAEAMLGYPEHGHSLDAFDPVLSLLQWAGEPADPPVYAGRAAAGRDVLMLQGIVDTYILPPIANATSLSFGLDLAGEALDEGHPELSAFEPLAAVLPYSGAEEIPLPASGNRDGHTRIVAQHPEDGIEDGHEIVFQTEAPQRQYRCFLEAVGRGAVPVVEEGGEEGECAAPP